MSQTVIIMTYSKIQNIFCEYLINKLAKEAEEISKAYYYLIIT